MLKFALFALLAYLTLAALLFISQRKMLYLPSSVMPSELSAQQLGVSFWPSREQYRGFIGNGADEHVNGTVVVFHGNAGGAYDRGYYNRALEPLGYRVILAEYPGYGGRPGKPSEAVFVADARQTINLAREQFGAPVYLWGESLGSGVAAAALADTTVRADGLVLLTPWDSLPALAQSIYWFLPARWLVLDEFDNVRNLQSFDQRVAVLVAERDEIVPARHTQRLYQAVQSDKRQWVFDGAGHNTWPSHPTASWWREVMNFVSVPTPGQVHGRSIGHR